MIRTRILLVASLFLLSGALGVWASGSSEKGASGPVTLTWWSPNFNDPKGAELAKKYQEQHPNVKIDVQETVATGLQDKVLVALQSGSVPNVIDIQVGWNIPYAATGELLALDSYIDKSTVVKPGDFWPANWNAATYEGKVYGIPYRAESHAFIYNKGMYSAAGLNPNAAPANWDQLLSYSQKLTNTSGSKPVYGIGIVGGGEVGNMIYNMVPWIWMNGGDILNKDQTKVVINEKGAVGAVQFYTDLYTKYHVVPPTVLQNGGDQNRDLFAQGVIAQFQAGNYIIPPVQKAAPDLQMGFGEIPAPAGAKPAAVLGGWNFVIPKGASNHDASWAFVQFLAQPDNMAYYTQTFPATKTAMENARFHKPDDKAFVEMLPYTRLTPTVKSWVQMMSVIQKSVQTVLLGQATAQQAMDSAASRMQGLLQQ